MSSEGTPPVWWVPGDGDLRAECALEQECGLTQVHCHVEGQVYYTAEELKAVYPDGLVPDQPRESSIDAIKRWMDLGTVSWPIGAATGPIGAVRSNHTPVGRAMDFNHTSHVHVSFDLTQEQTDNIIRVLGAAFNADLTFDPIPSPTVNSGDTITVNYEPEKPSWDDTSSDPVGDVVKAWEELKANSNPSPVGPGFKYRVLPGGLVEVTGTAAPLTESGGIVTASELKDLSDDALFRARDRMSLGIGVNFQVPDITFGII